MKVIIPCGGFGTRVAPWTKYISKELLPINGMPVICKVINELLECKEIDEIIFVTSSEKELMKKIILQHFPSKHQYFNFVIDDTHKGLDNSILIAKPYCKNTDATIFY
jgi:UTP-glucose-1-phosphate uridylyltransferase